MSEAPPSLVLEPIGFVRSPYTERAEAPRQAAAARGIKATIELSPGKNFEDALSDLAGWERIWVLFWFHGNTGWRPKVLPPRSDKRRGVFSTRSPHRPNPIGMSAVELVSVQGLTLHVRDVDMLDGTPVFDIKPYVAYADAFPEARPGWLDAEHPVDPRPAFDVIWSERTLLQRAWLEQAGAGEFTGRIESALALGPQPHAYRRIKREGDAFVLAVKDWRVRFTVEGRCVIIETITTGYREAELANGKDPALSLHRRFVAAFGR